MSVQLNHEFRDSERDKRERLERENRITCARRQQLWHGVAGHPWPQKLQNPGTAPTSIGELARKEGLCVHPEVTGELPEQQQPWRSLARRSGARQVETLGL